MYFFLGTVVFSGFTCFGNNLSKTGRIFLANITSTRDIWDGVFSFGIMWYTWRNCCKAFPDGVSFAFFKSLFKVSTNLLACPFDLGWYVGVVMWSTWKSSMNSWKSPDVNWVPLFDTKQSTTTTRSHNSWRVFCSEVSSRAFTPEDLRPLGETVYQVVPCNPRVSVTMDSQLWAMG